MFYQQQEEVPPRLESLSNFYNNIFPEVKPTLYGLDLVIAAKMFKYQQDKDELHFIKQEKNQQQNESSKDQNEDKQDEQTKQNNKYDYKPMLDSRTNQTDQSQQKNQQNKQGALGSFLRDYNNYESRISYQTSILDIYNPSFTGDQNNQQQIYQQADKKNKKKLEIELNEIQLEKSKQYQAQKYQNNFYKNNANNLELQVQTSFLNSIVKEDFSQSNTNFNLTDQELVVDPKTQEIKTIQTSKQKEQNRTKKKHSIFQKQMESSQQINEQKKNQYNLQNLDNLQQDKTNNIYINNLDKQGKNSFEENLITKNKNNQDFFKMQEFEMDDFLEKYNMVEDKPFLLNFRILNNQRERVSSTQSFLGKNNIQLKSEFKLIDPQTLKKKINNNGTNKGVQINQNLLNFKKNKNSNYQQQEDYQYEPIQTETTLKDSIANQNKSQNYNNQQKFKPQLLHKFMQQNHKQQSNTKEKQGNQQLNNQKNNLQYLSDKKNTDLVNQKQTSKNQNSTIQTQESTQPQLSQPQTHNFKTPLNQRQKGCYQNPINYSLQIVNPIVKQTENSLNNKIRKSQENINKNIVQKIQQNSQNQTLLNFNTEQNQKQELANNNNSKEISKAQTSSNYYVSGNQQINLNTGYIKKLSPDRKILKTNKSPQILQQNLQGKQYGTSNNNGQFMQTPSKKCKMMKNQIKNFSNQIFSQSKMFENKRKQTAVYRSINSNLYSTDSSDCNSYSEFNNKKNVLEELSQKSDLFKEKISKLQQIQYQQQQQQRQKYSLGNLSAKQSNYKQRFGTNPKLRPQDFIFQKNSKNNQSTNLNGKIHFTENSKHVYTENLNQGN
ncbi:hypothetical protein PPERSA_01268 [Pseudocohnilembus persalinus]|uniref:Uncharacterized protein n=1 Tax=Pseudocohnilembus persalinus TaxID=266149 RepID=A0A0V0QH43_PSEPJ|nr:hypothetical protein PPERSA_01268 [Pseudocohnilembus persalinus]|eukprot:KRX01365.1 hypothetical protein PPERSA_01268 [Pseudocohnilembus persalinus]